MNQDFPIYQQLDEVARALATHHVVLEAPPGAGKSTVLPAWLLHHHQGWQGQIILVQPRRVAAVSVARYIATLLADFANLEAKATTKVERLGQRVGVHIRGQRQLSQQTQLIVVTEGILTRMLQQNPELTGVGLVIFDEFHERNLHADLGLALCLDVLALRPDLRLMIMSATLPGRDISAWLTQQDIDHRLVVSTGRQYQVQLHYRSIQQHSVRQGSSQMRAGWQQSLAPVVREALALAQKGVLVFLPGQKEIQALMQEFAHFSTDVHVMPLYGGLSLEQQQRALAPLPAGQGIKLVFATNLAETSLTIPDIDVVVDSGRERQAHYEPHYGFTRLSTRMISQASAVQRAGRAGRVMAGHCFRLWSEETTERLAAYAVPAIERESLTNLVLELSLWGVRAEQLAWFTPPAKHLLTVAEQELMTLQALVEGRLTPLGQRLAQSNTYVRYGIIIDYARQQPRSTQSAAAWLIANLEEREAKLQGDIHQALQERWQQRKQLPRTGQRYLDWLRYFNLPSEQPYPGAAAPLAELLLQGFPERVAQAQGKRWQLATGLALRVDAHLSVDTWLIAVELSLTEQQHEAQLWLYARLPKELLISTPSPLLAIRTLARWQGEQGGLVRLEQTKWGQLLLTERTLAGEISPTERGVAMAEWLLRQGWSATAWGAAEEDFCARMQTYLHLKQTETSAWQPQALLQRVANWGLPWLETMVRRDELKRWSPLAALKTLLDYEQQHELAHLLPSRWQAPSGRYHRISYQALAAPVVALKLQEVFGTLTSPRLADGRLVLAFELLSPAGQLLHRTADLASFWQTAWPEVRKQMRGRYPKHPWPENPATATATHLTKRALAQRSRE